jgi:DNA-binding IclR family transcriptional regulator
MDVIRAVAQFQRSGASLNRVAKATNLNPSTAFRILRSLTEERMLRYDERKRCYHLGLLAFELGLMTQGQSQVQNRWQETIENIARRTHLTTYLMARSDREAVCLLCVQGTMVIRAMPMVVGQRLPLGIGAGSLAILATLDDEEIERILDALRPRLDLFPRGREEAPRIIERIAETRAKGFSVSAGSVAAGVAGVGVAIQPDDGLLQLAISVSAVTDSINPIEAQQFASIIQACVRNHRLVGA